MQWRHRRWLKVQHIVSYYYRSSRPEATLPKSAQCVLIFFWSWQVVASSLKLSFCIFIQCIYLLMCPLQLQNQHLSGYSSVQLSGISIWSKVWNKQRPHAVGDCLFSFFLIALWSHFKELIRNRRRSKAEIEKTGGTQELFSQLPF